MGAVSGQLLSQEELEKSRAESAYYETLPLEDCILVEDSVADVKDEYQCSVEGTITWYTVRQEDLDGDGIQRCGMFRAPSPDGRSVYLPVICRRADGTLQGMVYRVPQALEYPGT